MINEVKSKLNDGFEKVAKENIIKKLKENGIDYQTLSSEDFNELVKREKDILQHDAKKMGIGVGIGIGISLLLGI